MCVNTKLFSILVSLAKMYKLIFFLLAPAYCQSPLNRENAAAIFGAPSFTKGFDKFLDKNKRESTTLEPGKAQPKYGAHYRVPVSLETITTIFGKPLDMKPQGDKIGGAPPDDDGSRKKCTLPPYPAHGRYTVKNVMNASPGDSSGLYVLNVTCDPGYDVIGSPGVFCFDGTWAPSALPECKLHYWVPVSPEIIPAIFRKPLDMKPQGDKIGGAPPDDDGSRNKCTLPPYPAHGRYTVKNVMNASPGDSLGLYVLNVTCDPGYDVFGSPQVFCFDGTWAPTALPECKRYCKLNTHPSVEYTCRFALGDFEGSRPCRSYEPAGTVAWPECKKPVYVSNSVLPSMRCGDDGRWDETPICIPDCGQGNAHGAELVSGGKRVQRGELPWHAGIYRKIFTPFKQICGGSIVKPSVVISAAHCFWSNGELLPANEYAVAAGKLYRPWNDPEDLHTQYADVECIHVPQRFQGTASNVQHDLAILRLFESFVYNEYIRPVCLDLTENFDHLQLIAENTGKVAGWGLTDVNGTASTSLKVVNLPIVPYDVCFKESPIDFRAYITEDKICAGYKNKQTSVCKGDSGGGLVIAQYERGTYRYYLRGVVSTAPNDNINLCNVNSITTFTHLLEHAAFIKSHL